MSFGRVLIYRRPSAFLGPSPAIAGRGRALSRGRHWPRDRAPLGRKPRVSAHSCNGRSAETHDHSDSTTQRRCARRRCYLLASSSSVRSERRSPVPACRSSTLSRAAAVKDGHRAAAGLSLTAVSTMAASSVLGCNGPRRLRPAEAGFLVQARSDQASNRIISESDVDGCGGRIRTFDLRVMSPTSCQTAPPRVWRATKIHDCVSPRKA